MELIANILRAILFGVVEGITEWLPVSSTGHLIILEKWMGLTGTYGEEFYNLFLIVIQFGAILAVIITFFKKIWPFGRSKTLEEKRETWILIFNVIIACFPAVIAGLLFDDIIEDYLHGVLAITITLIFYGILFVFIELYYKKKVSLKEIANLKDITWKSALIIGLSQVLSLIPGTSRSGITIIAALLIGFSRSNAAEFSFILSIPMIVGASLYKSVKFAVNDGFATIPSYLQTEAIIILFVGTVVAFVVSIFTIKFFMQFIKSKTFTGFGIYRICLGILLIILASAGLLAWF